MSRLAVIAALPQELECLNSMRRPTDAVAIRSGIGPERATATAEAAIEADAGALLSFGFAGGLAGYRPGSVIVPEQVLWNDDSFATDVAWCTAVRCALAGLGVSAGKLLTVEAPVTTPREKANLGQQTGAVAVDMESGAIAETARTADIPFIAIRVVCDAVTDRLPRPALLATKPDGRVSLTRLAVALLQQPGETNALLRLGRSARKARATLRQIDAIIGPGFARPQP